MDSQADTNLGMMLDAIRHAGRVEGAEMVVKKHNEGFAALIDVTIAEIDLNPAVVHSNKWVSRRLGELRAAMSKVPADA